VQRKTDKQKAKLMLSSVTKNDNACKSWIHTKYLELSRP